MFKKIFRVLLAIAVVITLGILYDLTLLQPYKKDAELLMVLSVNTPEGGGLFAAFQLPGEELAVICPVKDKEDIHKHKSATLTLTKTRITGFLTCTGFTTTSIPSPQKKRSSSSGSFSALV